MCTYFEVETDVAQNLVDDFFFLILTVWWTFHMKDFKWEKMVCGVNFLKKQVL